MTSTYYGDGSNLTGISSDPFPYTGSAIISGSLNVIGGFNVVTPPLTRNSVSVTNSEIKFLLADNGNDNQAITIDRDGSSSSDVVALNIGSNIKIKRNGGGTPSFSVGNSGFVYEQTYNGDSITNSNPFNNGAGMGIRNTSNGTPVICSLAFHGVFGAGNSAGSTLHIGNPTGFASSTGTEEYNNGQNVFFKNNTLLEIAYGPASGSNDVDIIRYQASNTDSITDYRHGLQLSAVPNAGASTSSGRGQATNGSNVIDMDTVGYDVRSFVKVGQSVYVQEGWTTSIDNTENIIRFTITGVDYTNETITLNSNWTGTTGNVSCWIEDTLVVIRNYDGDERFRFYGDGTLKLQGNITASSGDITTNTISTISTLLASDSATNVDTFATATYTGAIYDYTLVDTTVGARAGQFMVAQDNGSITFTDTSTKHLFDPTIPEITAQINGANVEVQVTNGNGYTFKAFTKKL